ncbi:MAG: GWxTD domain-containing protein [Candidatus Aminicenantes bacterium]|nr:GWxTD domain-containing protein [Candidatus Aminicenantes bacterium]
MKSQTSFFGDRGVVRRTAAALAVLALCTVSPLFSQLNPKDLPQKYRTWIEEEVVYLITPGEKAVFLELTTDRQRDSFIEAFWRHRDPTPGTDKNEFREEHIRRLNYVDRYYRGTGKPGWKTDRGKVYIILGPPMSIREFTGIATLYEAQTWSYQDLTLPGLPSAFDLLFYQRNGMGDFILYNPAADGPWNLMSNYRGNVGDYAEAYEALSVMEPELARASVSFIPGETVVTMPSLMSMSIIQNLDASAYRSVEDSYARKFREYKDIVEVEYSANYIDSSSVVQALQDPSGTWFVHYVLEPSNISMGGYDSGISTDLIFNGILTDTQGRTIYQFENKVPLRFNREQFEKLRQRPFAFAGVFPVVPGDYRLSVLMKNSVSKEFTSLEKTISIAAGPSPPRLTPLLLAFNAVRPEAPGRVPQPFASGKVRLYLQPDPSFITQDKLHVHTQILDLSPDLRAGGSLKFILGQDGNEIESRLLPLAENPDPLNRIEVFPLDRIPPGYYAVAVILIDQDGQEIDRQKKDFVVSTADYLPRPWVHSNSLLDAGGPALIENILGRQWAAKGDLGAAVPRLEKAYRAGPKTRSYAVDLARAYLDLDRKAEALAILQPFAAETETDHELSIVLGETYLSLGRFQEGLGVFQGALTSFGLSAGVLNKIGECHLGLGQTEEALAAWRKSLEIEPDQPALKERLETVEKRR